MKFIFIAYADEKMAYSLKRIGRQAGRLGIFDDIILYTPRELPDTLKQSPLMQHSYGGGYWAWKPCPDTIMQQYVMWRLPFAWEIAYFKAIFPGIAYNAYRMIR